MEEKRSIKQENEIEILKKNRYTILVQLEKVWIVEIYEYYKTKEQQKTNVRTLASDKFRVGCL